MRKNDHRFIFSLLYALLAFLSIYVMTSGGLGISFDSEEYLIMADRFLNGRWMGTFIPVWPPLYPLIMTGIRFISSAEPLVAARTVSILSYVLLVVAVFLLALFLQGKLSAHLSTVSSLCLAPLTYIYCFCWSETLYTALSVLFFLFLTLFIKSTPEERNKFLLLAAAFAGLGSVTRFVGISLIITGILSVFLLSGYHPLYRKLKKTLIFILLALIPLILQFFLCFLYYGLATKPQLSSTFTFWHQLSLWFSTIYGDFLSFDLSFLKYLLFFEMGALDYWLRIVVLIGILLSFIVMFSRPQSAASTKIDFRPQAAILIYLFLYSVVILSVSSIIAIDPIGSRFTVPLYPLLLVLVFTNISTVYRRLTLRSAKRMISLMIFASILSFWGIQTISSLSILRGISSGSFPTMEQPGNLHRESLRFLKKQVKSSEIVITNIPRKLSFIWPRYLPFQDIRKADWETSQEELIYLATKGPIYILFCTEDHSPLSISVEEMERADQKLNLIFWEKDFGNDVIFKTKRMVIDNQ